MRNELMTRQPERHRLLCSASDGTPKPILIEPKRGFYVMDWKGEMKDGFVHGRIVSNP